MRVITLHPDVLVATSAVWQTNCVIVRGPGEEEETFVIDSPILPEELDALPALVEQAGFPAPSGLLATHGDWDHLLGRLAFPDLALGCAESTAQRLTAEPGAAQRELRKLDRKFYIERSRPLVLGQLQSLPVPGRCEIGGGDDVGAGHAGHAGGHELELYPANGHTVDGMAVWIGWARVLVAGDYLSTVEAPTVEGGSVEAYLATLERLRPLAASAEHVVPGHGPVLSSERALEVLDEHAAAL